MTEAQLVQLTKRFTKKELENTGAKLKDIDYNTFKILVKFRESIGSQVYPLFNGITTGTHKSKGHEQGKAFDVRIPKKNSYDVYKSAIFAGFNKIGIYWNGSTYSYHLELAPFPAFWAGYKKEAGKGTWTFKPLIVNPKDLV